MQNAPSAAVKDGHNSFLDFLKGVGSIGVVLVHFPFPGPVGKCLASIGLCGVILFFLISGYYSYTPQSQTAPIRKRLIRNAKLFALLVFGHFVFAFCFNWFCGTLPTFLYELQFSWLWIRLLTIGDCALFYSYQFWFLVSLVYGYVFFYFFAKYRLWKALYALLPLLLLLRVYIETRVNTYGLDTALAANVLIAALPLMLLGHYLASQKEAIQKIPLPLLAASCVLSLLFTFVTVAFPWRIDISQIGKLWTAVSFFALAIQKPSVRVSAFLCRLGSKLSMHIYFIHVAAGTLVQLFLSRIGCPELAFSYLLPVLTVLLSCAAGWLISQIPGKKG